MCDLVAPGSFIMDWRSAPRAQLIFALNPDVGPEDNA